MLVKVSVVIENRNGAVSRWLGILTVAGVVAVIASCSPAQAMQGFKPSTSGQPSAYSNGRSNREAPGVTPFQKGDQTKSSTPFAPLGNRDGSSFNSPPQRNDNGIGSTSPETSSNENSNRRNCTVEFIDVVDLPALETGELMNVFVREGDTVPTGKVVAQINDVIYKHQLRQALLRFQLANEKATDMIAMEASQQKFELTKVEYEIANDLARKGAKSPAERRKAKYDMSISELEIKAAARQKKESGIEADLEQARADEVRERIERHAIKSKFDGSVVEMFRHAGEWVTAGEPIAKVARMDRLYVQGLIPNNEYNPGDVAGKEVVVTVQLARDQTMDFPGKIVIIGSRDVAGAGNEFMVKAEIVNKMDKGQWVLRKDSRVSMKIKF